jgi:hypothetical protein
MPKFLDLVFRFYTPALYLELGLLFFWTDDWEGLFLPFAIFALYLQSPLIWRLMSSVYGPVPLVSRIGVKVETGSLWLVSHRLQEIYETFEVFERVLKTFPGVYSMWLRLWGARIGKKVNWTAGCKIVDRPFLRIGDRCLIGNQSYITAHAIKKKQDRYQLFVKEVRVGSDVVVSFSATLAPGAVIGDGAFIEAGAVVYPNQEIPEGRHHERFEELLHGRFDFLRAKS